MSTSRPICTGFEGNSDIYGLGIRTGVYLQWFSSWLCMTLNPETAQELHATNSIFVFAIIIAAVVAATSGEDPFRPVEAYILIQVCFGYLFTVLSVLGLRLQCMTPTRLAQLLDHLNKVPKNIFSATKAYFRRHSGQDPRAQHPTALRNASVREVLKMALQASLAQTTEDLARLAAYKRLDSVGFLKSGNLTWVGVQWRVALACLVASFNVWLWFSGINGLDTEHDCDSFIFMFGKERLRGAILTLLRAGAVIYLVVMGLIFLIFSSVAMEFVAYVVKSLVQWRLFSILRNRGLLEVVQRKAGQVGAYWRRIRRQPLVTFLIETNFQLQLLDRTWAALLHLISEDAQQVPIPSDLLQTYAILSSRKAEGEQDHENQARQAPPLRRSVWSYPTIPILLITNTAFMYF